MIFKPMQEAVEWKPLLARPDRQWKTGFSARTLAHCWQEVDGFPGSVVAALNSPSGPFSAIKPLIIFPEHKVPLPGGRASSQCDIWVLAKDRSGLVSIAVEGKVAEPFGPTVNAWLKNASTGKRERIQFIQSKLELDSIPGSISYQLLHRTVAAILEAERFEARNAVLLVHSFSDRNLWFSEFQQYVSLFGVTADLNRTQTKRLQSGLSLHFSWIEGEKIFLTR
jgi:hypothetical protein